MGAIRHVDRDLGQGSDLLDSYWHDIRNCEPISREEEVALVRRARRGDQEAMNRLVSCNLRFVVTIAKEYRDSGQPLSELISDGNLGLLEAAKRFDENRGFKFITYAVWWIRQSIQRALADRKRTVPAPSNRIADLKSVERTEGQLAQELGRSPTVFELSDEVGFSAERISRAREAGSSDLYLDRALYDEEDTPVMSLFETSEKAPAAAAEETDLVSTVDRCLGTLDDRERQIIRWYYGFDGHEPMTLEEIGDAWGLTRERIRQLRDRGLDKLRDHFGDVLVELSRRN
ncbi:MAG: RNA polymerase sigma factor RpoD/SigA [Gemmatimonadota bacterium]